MLARRVAVDLNDGHALLAVLVSALAPSRPANSGSLSSARRAAANPSRYISHRAYSTTAATASPTPSRPRSSAPEQAHADETRRRFCDLAVRERLAEERDAGYEGPIASTSAVTLDSPAPPLAGPPPATAAASRPPHSKSRLPATSTPFPLLKSLRSAQRLSPGASPSSLLASQRPILYDDESDAQHPPTPPPPIAFLPQADGPNPHLLSAALLQAIFLGASAMGLLMRKRVRNDGGKARAMDDGREEDILDDMVVQRRWAMEELETRRKEGELALDDVPALNLLLSAYAEVDPEVSVDWEKQMSNLERNGEKIALLQRRKMGLERVASLLAQFDRRALKPDHWTVLAVLAFANPKDSPSIKALDESAFGQSQPVLTEWAWKAYAELDSAGTTTSAVTTEAHLTIIHTFVQFLDSPLSDSLPPNTRRKMLTSISSRFLPWSSSSTTLPSPPPSLLLQLGLLALHARCTNIVTPLITESLLPPRERQSLALAILEAASIDEEWRQNRDLIRFVCETLVDAITALCKTTRREELDIPLLERASRLLIEGFGVDIPLEPFIVSLLVTHLRLPDGHSLFSPDFLTYILTSLINARQPSSAYRIFSLIPRPHRTTRHYYPLLRSHHHRTGRNAWQELQERWAAKEIRPEVKAWEARLTGLIQAGSGGGMAPSKNGPSTTRAINRRRAKEALELADQDLLLLQKHGIARSTKLSNKFLKLSSKASDEPSWRRHVGRQWRDVEEASAGVVGGEGGQEDEGRRRSKAVRGKVDEATRVIMVGRHLESSDRGPRSSSYGKKQIREMKEELAKGERSMHRRFGKGGRRAPEEQEKVDILPNIVLNSLTRWPREINTETLVKLAAQSLNIDLSSSSFPRSPSSPPTTLLGLTIDPQPIPTPDQFSMLRRPAYRTLLKAFRNRGERMYHRRLLERLQVEERWVRRKAMGLDRGEEPSEGEMA
ncbi:hypothetical protein BCR35DRAFT_302948 [Leucosporidium creatinivorum]|uniref:Uncharacterized protein n=1 Tax=Leucosporidium creatinivorum TaxID=106004 RepID=A0A1Y2FM24_9BASI|nr:hypothetical protein BCR35DRAFT_302948 [Leucosporidium creatinivorum]